MANRNLPVQVLAACGVDGQMQPLRFRFEDSEHQLHTVHITEIIDSRFVEYVGIETFVFLCKALFRGRGKALRAALHRPHPPLDPVPGGLLMAEPVWFHIDVNSAFLSWTAAYRTLVEGRTPDLREIPSVIANDKNLRTSIVLAKSTPAKKNTASKPESRSAWRATSARTSSWQSRIMRCMSPRRAA